MYLAAGGTTFTVLIYCIGSTAADCTYIHIEYDNRTSTYREDIRYRHCLRTEECCGNSTDRRCCLLKSQDKTETDDSQYAPALLLAGITAALVVIGVIAIFCWRLVCISAYTEASHVRGHNQRHRRVHTSGTRDNQERSQRHHQGSHRQNHGSHGQNHGSHGPHHGSHGPHQGSHGLHDGSHGHHVRVSPLDLQYILPVVLPDEYLAGPQPPAYTKDAPSPASKYIAPPSYEDSVHYKERDPPPPAYTLTSTDDRTDSTTDDRTDSCSSDTHVDMDQEEESSRDQPN